MRFFSLSLSLSPYHALGWGNKLYWIGRRCFGSFLSRILSPWALVSSCGVCPEWYAGRVWLDGTSHANPTSRDTQQYHRPSICSNLYPTSIKPVLNRLPHHRYNAAPTKNKNDFEKKTKNSHSSVYVRVCIGKQNTNISSHGQMDMPKSSRPLKRKRKKIRH